jgi:DNA-nicking Smr family endonuclease
MGSPRRPTGGSEVDLHGLRPEQALHRLEMGLHTARIQGLERLLVITGRGWGNRLQQPVLRRHVEDWLRQRGARFGVQGWEETSRGGALLVELRRVGADEPN